MANTDAEHYATTGDIITYLKENGISCDRKTIPGDIAKLCDIGIDIEEERSRENRYSLSSHMFTLPEVKLQGFRTLLRSPAHAAQLLL